MLKYVVYSRRLHIFDMMDEMSVMDSRGPVKPFISFVSSFPCYLSIMKVLCKFR